MSFAFTLAFVFFLLLMVGLKLWLASRQIRHVRWHAATVPAQFSDRISLEAHRKAADYTIAHARLEVAETLASAVILIALTLVGGLQWIADLLRGELGSGLVFQLALIATVALLLGVLDLPFAWLKQFGIEQRFGFNRMTPGLWLVDLVKSVLVTAALGLPLAAAVIALMRGAGELWWIHVWLVWIGFNGLVLLLYPTLIAPIFNRFEPLRDASLSERIGALLERTGFSSRGVFVMDGSRRSAHGNAYFTGLGRAKRIVFFDTLIERLQPAEIEATLAHELGHFKLRHIAKRLVFSFALSLGFLALLGWLSGKAWFYEALGVTPLLTGGNEGLALVLFMLALPVFTFVFAPLTSILSRKHEYEADAYAARHASASDLISALVKLYQDNAATLTPDPLHSAFYDSHPPAALRVARLARLRPA